MTQPTQVAPEVLTATNALVEAIAAAGYRGATLNVTVWRGALPQLDGTRADHIDANLTIGLHPSPEPITIAVVPSVTP